VRFAPLRLRDSVALDATISAMESAAIEFRAIKLAARPRASVLQRGTLILGAYSILDVLEEHAERIRYSARGIGTTAGRFVVSVPNVMATRLELIEAFARQSLLLESLRHPGIVPVVAAGVDAGTIVMVSPETPGTTLRARLDTGRAIDGSKVIRIVRDVAEVMEALHAHKPSIVHRILEPSGIILGPTHALMQDVGYAHALEAVEIAATDPTVPTPAAPYGAPECEFGGRVGPEADQYSLAVIARECHSGAVPAGVSAVIERATSKDARDRFPSIMAFADAFTEAMQKEARAKEVTGSGPRPRGMSRPETMPSVKPVRVSERPRSKAPESIRASMIDRSWDTGESSRPVAPSKPAEPAHVVSDAVLPCEPAPPVKKAPAPVAPTPPRSSASSVSRSLPTPTSGVMAISDTPPAPPVPPTRPLRPPMPTLVGISPKDAERNSSDPNMPEGSLKASAADRATGVAIPPPALQADGAAPVPPAAPQPLPLGGTAPSTNAVPIAFPPPQSARAISVAPAALREQAMSMPVPRTMSTRPPAMDEGSAAFPRLEASRRADARARTTLGLLIFAAAVVFSVALVVAANRVAGAIESASHASGQAAADDLPKAPRTDRGTLATSSPQAGDTNDVPSTAAPATQTATTDVLLAAPPSHDSPRQKAARARPARH
jgi:hypothetical protein